MASVDYVIEQVKVEGCGKCCVCERPFSKDAIRFGASLSRPSGNPKVYFRCFPECVAPIVATSAAARYQSASKLPGMAKLRIADRGSALKQFEVLCATNGDEALEEKITTNQNKGSNSRKAATPKETPTKASAKRPAVKNQEAETLTVNERPKRARTATKK